MLLQHDTSAPDLYSPKTVKTLLATRSMRGSRTDKYMVDTLGMANVR